MLLRDVNVVLILSKNMAPVYVFHHLQLTLLNINVFVILQKYMIVRLAIVVVQQIMFGMMYIMYVNAPVLEIIIIPAKNVNAGNLSL